jgi:8-oxo-dGTP pyrophosphatase MutT (NUDIX family)
MDPKLLTLLIVVKNGKLLLGRKKRGFGEGYYNGFGGKVEPGETIEAAALRELEEEACIKATSIDKRGILTFIFDDKPQPWEVHVFYSNDFCSTPAETDEMCPEWFDPQNIPFDKMWADDIHWYPLFLAGKKFRGTFHFKDTHTLTQTQLQEVEAL